MELLLAQPRGLEVILVDVFNESASLVCTRFGYMLPTYLISIEKPTINKGSYIYIYKNEKNIFKMNKEGCSCKKKR